MPKTRGQVKEEISMAAEAAVRTIANAAQEAAKVVSTAAAEALRVSNDKSKGNTDHDTLTTLVGSVVNLDVKFTDKFTDLKTDISKMSNKMDEYSHAFVPRSEFDQLTVIVRGVANDGGLVKKTEDIEKRLIWIFAWSSGAAAIIALVIDLASRYLNIGK